MAVSGQIFIPIFSFYQEFLKDFCEGRSEGGAGFDLFEHSVLFAVLFLCQTLIDGLLLFARNFFGRNFSVKFVEGTQHL